MTAPNDLPARTDPPLAGDLKAQLIGFLDYHRATLRRKCTGLRPEQLLIQATPPSDLRLLGLLRHLTEVEAWWLPMVFAGEEEYEIYCSEADPDGDLNVTEADADSVAAAWARYDEEVGRADAIIAAAELPDLAARSMHGSDAHCSLGWILIHLVEEYARHNGHADLLRQAVDGATGE